MLFSIAITLHLLSAVIWVGGMFFAYVVLRPSAGSLLEGPDRLTLWSGVFQRFFPWVWVAIVILLSTGNVMIFSVFGGMQQAGLHIHVMNGIGWIMFLLFLYLNTVPFRGLRTAVSNSDWAAGAGHLVTIRHIVAINLSLGLIVIAVASAGQHLL